MITLLGTLLGFLGAAFPEIMKYFNRRQDNKHELDLTDKQIELQKLMGTQKMEELATQADMQEFKILHDHAAPTGVTWVDALAGTVRPFLTYAFFITYVCVKIAMYQMLTSPEMLPWLGKAVSMDWKAAIVQLWTEEDQAIFSSIIAFWFGRREIKKWSGRK